MKFIDNVPREEYTKFVLSHQKSHFLQSYGWGQFCEKYKHQKAVYVGLKDDKGKLVATSLILLRNMPFGYSYGYSPRGFILDYDDNEIIKEFTNCLNDYMKKNNIVYIKFDPDIKYQDIDEFANPVDGGENNYKLYDYMLSLGYKHTGFYRLYEGNQPRYTFRINLKNKWEDIEGKFSKSFLKSLKRSYNYDLEIDNDMKPELFYNLIKNNSEKNDFDAHDIKYYEIFTNEMQKDNNVKYFNVSLDAKKITKKINTELKSLKEQLNKGSKKSEDIKNQITRLEKELDVFSNIKEDKLIVCSLICTYTNNRAWSLFIGNNDIGNLTFAVTRSYYEAIKDAYENSYEFFDLFGTPGDPNTKYKNLAKLHDFKRKFGDQYIEFIGEFDLVNKKFLYKLLPILLKVYRKLRKIKTKH